MAHEFEKELDGFLISLREEYRDNFGFYPEDAPDEDDQEDVISDF